MKTIIILLLCQLLNGCINAQKPDEVIDLSHKVINIIFTTGGGNHTYPTIIGSDSNSINIIHKLNNMNESLNLEMYKLRSQAVEYIAKYISNHCNTVNRINQRSIDFYTIRVYSKNQTQVCYLADKSVAKPYIEGLINWIEKSPYKKECKGILYSLEHDLTYLKKQ